MSTTLSCEPPGLAGKSTSSPAPGTAVDQLAVSDQLRLVRLAPVQMAVAGASRDSSSSSSGERCSPRNAAARDRRRGAFRQVVVFRPKSRRSQLENDQVENGMGSEL